MWYLRISEYKNACAVPKGCIKCNFYEKYFVNIILENNFTTVISRRVRLFNATNPRDTYNEKDLRETSVNLAENRLQNILSIC